eukprot:3399148-Pleurochrysis_carterae.AAC.1
MQSVGKATASNLLMRANRGACVTGSQARHEAVAAREKLARAYSPRAKMDRIAACLSCGRESARGGGRVGGLQRFCGRALNLSMACEIAFRKRLGSRLRLRARRGPGA